MVLFADYTLSSSLWVFAVTAIAASHRLYRSKDVSVSTTDAPSLAELVNEL